MMEMRANDGSERNTSNFDQSSNSNAEFSGTSSQVLPHVQLFDEVFFSTEMMLLTIYCNSLILLIGVINIQQLKMFRIIDGGVFLNRETSNEIL
uniref:Uncharacterized protein n=1 Tax=Parascaris univalens TaxID=6257 RepID=A0A915B7F9_PARUN